MTKKQERRYTGRKDKPKRKHDIHNSKQYKRRDKYNELHKVCP